MTIYNPNIPTGLINLDVDYKNIQNNFSQLDTSYGKDHFAFSNGTPQNGIHKQVTLVNEAAPGLGAGSGVLYANTVAGNSWPIWQNALGATVMMSSPTSAAASGYCSLPGGLLLQWGIATVTASGVTPLLFVTNNKNFDTNCFMVQVTGIRNNSGGDGIFVLTGSVSKFGFSFRNGSGSIVQAYWMAIGN